MMRGIRGAITVEEDSPDAILQASTELLQAMLQRNKIRLLDIVSIVFSCTSDLQSVAPARAGRDMGWTQVPMLCVQEMHVQGGLTRCIRVLMHSNSKFSLDKIQHVYLRDAVQLRPDLMEEQQ